MGVLGIIVVVWCLAKLDSRSTISIAEFNVSNLIRSIEFCIACSSTTFETGQRYNKLLCLVRRDSN